MIYGNPVGGSGAAKTYILEDDYGNEAVATVSDDVVTIDADANDIRLGKTAATVLGATVGTKVIPSYHTSEGYRIIPSGSDFVIPNLNELNKFEFTKLQGIICPFNGSIDESVAAEKVVINECVYVVNSTEAVAVVAKDSENKAIDLGFVNDESSHRVLRYFTYKEIY